MEISIVVTSYKNPELLKLCLDSILRETRAIDIDCEIIVADSATEEATEMMMREDYPSIKFFSHARNVGFQSLVKKGISVSRGKFILLLNGDIIVKSGAVEKMLSFIKARPETGIVGPRLLNFNGTSQPSCFRFYRPLTILYRRTWLGKTSFGKKHLEWFLMRDIDLSRPTEADWIMGSSLLISRRAITEVGFMDQRFFMYMEDVDWCRRFWEKGWKVMYYPEAEMYHYHGKGSSRGGFFATLLFNKLTWVHISSAIKYFHKYKNSQSIRLKSKK